MKDCPVWSNWGDFSDCSVSCGGGSQQRVRSCLNGDVGEIGCHEGETTENQTCNTKVIIDATKRCMTSNRIHSNARPYIFPLQ